MRITVLLLMLLATRAQAELDLGDYRSETLTRKAWQATGDGDHAAALAYAAKCIELYEAEARQMQAALKELPVNESREETSKRWALNDVGTCLFIQGDVLLKQGDKPGAKAAFAKLVNHFKFAQCWDPQGWFWKPAEAAKQKLVELEFDEE
jgi:hypothetical protein